MTNYRLTCDKCGKESSAISVVAGVRNNWRPKGWFLVTGENGIAGDICSAECLIDWAGPRYIFQKEQSA